MFQSTPQSTAELLRVGGNDLEIVNAARVSYDGHSEEFSTDDEKLIDYLMRNDHSTPFEMPEVLFRITTSLAVTRQFMRHRTWSYNEISLRYVSAPDNYFVPKFFRGKPKNNKQGSSEPITDLVEDSRLKEIYNTALSSSIKAYHQLQEYGVANELARLVLPVSQMTQFYAKVDLRNFLHFLKLRMDPHAQQEIRELANQMHDLVAPYFPVTMKAWDAHVMSSKKFTQNEIEMIGKFLDTSEMKTEHADREMRILFDKLGIKVKGVNL